MADPETDRRFAVSDLAENACIFAGKTQDERKRKNKHFSEKHGIRIFHRTVAAYCGHDRVAHRYGQDDRERGRMSFVSAKLSRRLRSER